MTNFAKRITAAIQVESANEGSAGRALSFMISRLGDKYKANHKTETVEWKNVKIPGTQASVQCNLKLHEGRLALSMTITPSKKDSPVLLPVSTKYFEGFERTYARELREVFKTFQQEGVDKTVATAIVKFLK